MAVLEVGFCSPTTLALELVGKSPPDVVDPLPPERDCSMRFLKVGFFHQTTPPGAIRGSLEPFLILATFQGVYQI